MILVNSLKSDDFKNNVGLKYLSNAVGTDTASPRVASADAFVSLYTEKFGTAPSGPGLANSYDAAMIALLAMEAAGKDATGPEIAAKIAAVTDPTGTPIAATTAGFASAKTILAEGGTVKYQGATGDVIFDENGDVSAPAVVWKFTKAGVEELEYLSLEDVDTFISTLK